MIRAMNMSPREHQELVLANIAAAEKAGNWERAAILRKAFADLLAVKWPEVEPDRIPASPINKVELP